MFAYGFTIPYRKVLVSVLEQNIAWMEHTYKKIGNHIEVAPLGFQTSPKLVLDRSTGKISSYHHATIYLNVTNAGLSDQIMKDFEIHIHADSGVSSLPPIRINGLKARASQVIAYSLPFPTNLA